MIKGATKRVKLEKPFTNYVQYLNDTISLPKEYKYTAIDLFAGCGGLSLGFHAAGIKTIGYEMVEDCCKTYSENLDTECICEKLTTSSVFPKVNIVIGGPPCQPFSVGGKQLGAEDERNGFPIFIAAVRQIRPVVFLFENVRGVFYKNREYFMSVLRELEELGYTISYQLLNAADYDVPQNRERVFCIGSLKGKFVFPPPKPYLVSSGEAVGDIIDTLPVSPMYLTPSMDKYIAAYEAKSHCVTPRDLHLDMPARTVTCRNLAGATSDMQRYRLPDGKRRRLTPREGARLQSFPDWFVFSGSMDSQFNQVGNAVPPFLAYNVACELIKHIEGHGSIEENKQLSLFGDSVL